MNPSILVTPNSKKAGKLSSIIPTDGSGDLSVVRATTATRVNSDGLIELVPYNLLNYSEQFDNASWGKQNVSITTNQALSPNGTLTADLLSGVSVAQAYINQNATVVSGQTYTISIFAKKNQTNFLQIFGSQGFNLNNWANFDLENGIIGTTGVGVIASITPYDDGWYRCSIQTSNPLGTTGGSYFVPVNSATAPRNPSFDATNHSIYIWGAQLVQGSEAKEYLRTETGLNIPRLDYSNGCPSILVEPQRTNVLLRSEEFDNAIWTKSNSLVISNQSISPDGNTTADKIIPNTTNTNHFIIQYTSVVLGTTYTFSFFAKADGYNFTSTLISALNINVYWDLQNGTANGVGSSIVDYGNGWYRCIVTGTANITGIGSFRIYAQNSSISVFAGNDIDGILVWGAQLEAGSNATSYIPTTSASVTRNADVISKTGLSGITTITETFEDDTTNVISGSPTSYTMSQGRIKQVIGI